MPPQDLPGFVKWVIEQKPELRDAPADVRVEIAQQLEQDLERLINTALIANMPPAELPYFEQLMGSGSQAQIQKFIEQKVPNMHEVIAKVMVDFREQYVGGGSE